MVAQRHGMGLQPAPPALETHHLEGQFDRLAAQHALVHLVECISILRGNQIQQGLPRDLFQ